MSSLPHLVITIPPCITPPSSQRLYLPRRVLISVVSPLSSLYTYHHHHHLFHSIINASLFPPGSTPSPLYHHRHHLPCLLIHNTSLYHHCHFPHSPHPTTFRSFQDVSLPHSTDVPFVPGRLSQCRRLPCPSTSVSTSSTSLSSSHQCRRHLIVSRAQADVSQLRLLSASDKDGCTMVLKGPGRTGRLTSITLVQVSF
jgi:hypothetical protein